MGRPPAIPPITASELRRNAEILSRIPALPSAGQTRGSSPKTGELRTPQSQGSANAALRRRIGIFGKKPKGRTNFGSRIESNPNIDIIRGLQREGYARDYHGAIAILENLSDDMLYTLLQKYQG